MDSGRILRDEGIKLADDNAQAIWREEVDEVLNQLSLTRIPFTTDDVWALLTTTTQEPRALGAAMLRAAKDHIIVGTDSYLESLRPASHRRPLRVWVGI
jgi:hypothetical protein